MSRATILALILIVRSTSDQRINNESERANNAQGPARVFGGKTPEEKPQQTWTTLRLPLYARDLNAMTVNGRKSVVFN
jgi:hypothetical protein